MWHAQKKWAVSNWGGLYIRHAADSTEEAPKLKMTCVMYVTTCREQTAEAANVMLDKALADLAVSTEGHLHLWSDCGPHFRSSENLWHYVFDLCKSRHQVIHVNYLGEQHGKTIIDGASGTTGSDTGWLAQYAAKTNIFSVKGLLSAFKWGADRSASLDPEGPSWHVGLVEFPQYKPDRVNTLGVHDFKISRTYSLTLKPTNMGAFLPAFYNNVFSDSPPSTKMLTIRKITEIRAQVEWKPAYYEGEREWEQEGPKPGDDNVLVRKRADQKHLRSAVRPIKSFEEKVANLQQKAEKDKLRLIRKMAALKKSAGLAADDETEGDNADSDSISSSGSSSSESDPED